MNVFIWLICKLSAKQSLNLNSIHQTSQFWPLLSSLIPGTTPKSCLFKWLSERRYKITIHNWTPEQQSFLIQLQQYLFYIQNHRTHQSQKNKWKIISEQLYLLNQDENKIFRHPKQCRQHYASFLDPNIVKGPWTRKEDLMLISYVVRNNGDKKWCKLTKILQGRTQNAIKNRYQLVCTKLKKKKQNKQKTQTQMLIEYIKQHNPQFQSIFHQQAAKNQKQEKIQMLEKNSVQHQQIYTKQFIDSNQNLPLMNKQKYHLSEYQKDLKLYTPIFIRHPSSFRLYQHQNQHKNIFNSNIIQNQLKINQKQSNLQFVNLKLNIFNDFSNSPQIKSKKIKKSKKNV